MSVAWTRDEVQAALGVGPTGAELFSGVSTDTRAIAPGALFVALRGERFDAHDFLAQAVAAGAAGLVVDRDDGAARLGVPTYVVPDTLVALGALARHRRRAWGGTLVAVAGSNGKTSTKELVRAALGAARRVHATAGNFNNRVGLPLTLFAIPYDAEIVVAEVGTNVPGEVAILRDICEPNAAIVTSIGEEHLEGLVDLAGVLREEATIFAGVPVAITPAVQPEVAEAARPLADRVVSAGLNAGDVRPDAWRLAEDGTGWLMIDGAELHVPLRGEHNLRNAMLAVAVARELGVGLDAVARGFAVMPQPSMRTALESVGEALVLNDAYNANPSSMYAAFDLSRSIGTGRPRVAVLGEMLELGDSADRLHREVARRALSGTFHVVAGVGRFAAVLADEQGASTVPVVTAPDAEALWPLLEPHLAPNAFILLKGSRGMRLERLLPHLTAWATR